MKLAEACPEVLETAMDLLDGPFCSEGVDMRIEGFLRARPDDVCRQLRAAIKECVSSPVYPGLG